jgi:hypothetical protein
VLSLVLDIYVLVLDLVHGFLIISHIIKRSRKKMKKEEEEKKNM